MTLEMWVQVPLLALHTHKMKEKNPIGSFSFILFYFNIIKLTVTKRQEALNCKLLPKTTDSPLPPKVYFGGR